MPDHESKNSSSTDAGGNIVSSSPTLPSGLPHHSSLPSSSVIATPSSNKSQDPQSGAIGSTHATQPLLGPASSSAATSAMPSRVQIDTHARRRSRGQSISTSFSPVGAYQSPTAGTPTDVLSPTARARSISQSLQNAISPLTRTPAARDDNSSEDSLELNTLSSGDSDEETGLTEAARERRRKKKKLRKGLGGLHSDGGRMRDNAALTSANGHHHIHVPEEELIHGTVINGIAVTSSEKRLADRHVVKDLAVNVLLIGLWYLFSLLISIYNKWMFSPKHLDFKFPLFVTSMHMIVQFTLSSLVLWYFVQFRPGYSDPNKIKKSLQSSSSETSPTRDPESRPLNSERPEDTDDEDEDDRNLISETQEPGPKKPIMTKLFYVTRIAPCGMATGLDIGLGNMSLKYISLAFYTMCKSSSLAFVLIFAFIFRLEKPTIKLVSVITVMTIGVVMMVSDKAAFVLIGFILVMLASILSGLRWSLTQLLLLRNPATSNPFSNIFFLAPVMFLSLFIIAVPVEGIAKFWGRWLELVGEWGLLSGIGMLIAPGIVAFCMTASEFALLRRTSVVTLSICGIFKEVVTISASATIFHDKLTPINITGLLITILSIAGYNYIKIKQMRGEAVRDVLAGEADDAEGRRSLLFERRSLALNRSSLESDRGRSEEVAR
ncbi:hypothetical protein ABW19_dt0207844 [Dactylella cylindrospora]|nr:hypothetical protein ABW19_dt0207844 [Dactylella cylindrospora]